MRTPVYVNTPTPVEELTAFMTRFRVDENFRPLSRLLRRYFRGVDTLTDLPITAVVDLQSDKLTLTLTYEGPTDNLVGWRIYWGYTDATSTAVAAQDLATDSKDITYVPGSLVDDYLYYRVAPVFGSVFGNGDNVEGAPGPVHSILAIDPD